jgi:hypothetical protein
MAMIEEAVYSRLSGYAAVSALISTRLYPLVIPQDVSLPAIAYQKIDSTKTANHAGASQLARSRFQFTCQAETYSDAKALAEAVRHCWEGYRGTVATVRIDGTLIDNDQDGYNEPLSLVIQPSVRMDVIIWHAEA